MKKYIKYSLALIAIFTVGFAIYFFAIKSNNHLENGHQNDGYTCPMPRDSVFSDKPGKCSKCGMTLVKIEEQNEVVESKSIDNLLKPTDNFIVGNFQVTTPKDTILNIEINLPGIVSYDPNAAVNISARAGGRIERMYVNHKFQKVNKGQKLFDLYSPELLTEQQNFIYMISNDIGDHGTMIDALREKLALYGMTKSQIGSLILTKKLNPIISIYSPASGIIQGTDGMYNSGNPSMQSNSTTESLSIKEGDYIKKNETVFKLLNTDKVWGIFNVIQGYNSVIKTNQSIRISTELDEINYINARINFVETQLNPADKTNRIRVYLDNNRLKLPIGLRLQGLVKTNPVKGIWIQKQAMVSIGAKKIVFLKSENGFKAKTITTGIEIDDFIQVIDGISVQDSIAKNGNYLIDSESFIKTE